MIATPFLKVIRLVSARIGVHAITRRSANSDYSPRLRALEPECPMRVCLLPIPGNGGDVMGPRFPLFGSARQLRTDLRTLTSRRWRGGPTLSQRALALDRVAGSVFMLCLVVTSLWVADWAGLLTLPVVAESAQASTDPAALDPALAARPLTSAEVRLVQRKLKSLGFDPGAVDGVPGRHTLAALNAYLTAGSLGRASQVNRADRRQLAGLAPTFKQLSSRAGRNAARPGSPYPVSATPMERMGPGSPRPLGGLSGMTAGVNARWGMNATRAFRPAAPSAPP